MELLLIASSAIGWIMPVLVAVVVRSKWAGWVKGVIAAASSLILGGVAVASAGDLANVTDWLAAFLAVLTASQVAYQMWWKPTGIAAAIERNTQPTPLGLHAETNALANPARSRALRARPASAAADAANTDPTERLTDRT